MAQIVKGNGFPIVAKKYMRNSLYSCGSMKKQKNCCGASSEYYYSKLNEKQKADLKRKKEAEERAADSMESKTTVKLPQIDT